MEEREFYEEMLKPEAGNTMVFDIKSSDPDPTHTFSMEAMEGVSRQMMTFLMARISANAKLTGKPPKHSRIIVTIDPYAEGLDHLSEGVLPFYTGETDLGYSVADGERRMRALDS